MNDSLATYLRDHLAGAMHAIELVDDLRDKHSDTPLGEFATNLLGEIKADREVLDGIAAKVGTSASTIKDMTATLGEKMSQLKFKYANTPEFGTFEALELLELGIHGKWALWRTLATVSVSDPRLQGIDYDSLAARAQTQESSVEERRLEAAQVALRPALDGVHHH